ncbi:MAG: hypothetical protein K9N34_10835 [Candidatus Marinimicrobia bacterium]|nr:hypothetical protein [Candidatus Neomarinimicrobiota bacterium]
MKQIFLDYLDWKVILFGETGLPLTEKELFDYISKLASRDDTRVILTEKGIPVCELKYDIETGKFAEYKIGKI